MRTLWLLTFLLTFAPQCLADVVELSNGDRLTGRVKELSSGELTLQTPYAGEVKIDWNQIVRLTTEEQVSIEFRNGQVQAGPISSPEEGEFQVGAPDGPVVSRAEVVAIKLETPALPEPGILGNWHGNADLGYTVARGNNEINNLALSFASARRTRNDRITARFKSLHSVQNDVTASSLYRGSLRYDRFLSPRTFVFGIADFEKDELAGVELRTSQGGGVGIRLGAGTDTVMSLFGGATFLQEKFGTLERTYGSEGIAGVELEALFEPLIISTRTTILPLITDGRYRIEWDAGLRAPLFGGFSLGLQIFDSFDSNPPQPEIKKNDVGMVSTLGFVF
ncbi:MAG: DUF481 domain-containing protein [Acidobacteriota bacterium]